MNVKNIPHNILSPTKYCYIYEIRYEDHNMLDLENTRLSTDYSQKSPPMHTLFFFEKNKNKNYGCRGDERICYEHCLERLLGIIGQKNPCVSMSIWLYVGIL
jgi:hypothetical protein